MQNFEPKQNEITKINETAELSLDNQKELDFVLDDIFSDGRSLNWDKVLERLEVLKLSEVQKDQVRGRIMSYVQIIFRSGAFLNLQGIDKLLKYFDIENIGFSREYIEKIIDLYKTYSIGFLYNMSPSLYNGKLHNGKEYNRIEYVRGLLQELGVSDEKLTDEYIKELWDMREVLVKMHNKFRGEELSLENMKLANLVGLLSD